MYDLAKRSLVFTVATGGLLLTGSAFTPAMAAEAPGQAQGPTQAQGAADAVSAYQALHAATASGSGTAAVDSAPHGAAQSPDLLFPQAVTGAAGAAGPKHAGSPADESADPFHLPVDLGRQLCDSMRGEFSPGAVADGACGTDAGPGPSVQGPAAWAKPGCAGAVTTAHLGQADADGRRSPCATAEGSAATLPDASAAGSAGASATATSRGYGRMPIDVPVSTPMTRAATAPMGCADVVGPPAGADAVATAGPGSGAYAQAGGTPPGAYAVAGAGQGSGAYAVAAADSHPTQTTDPCLPNPEWYPVIPPRHHAPFPQPTCPPKPVTHSLPPSPAPITHLPQTGADVEVELGAAGAALLAGLGLSGASRRRRHRAH